jgi:hypothetical protein
MFALQTLVGSSSVLAETFQNFSETVVFSTEILYDERDELIGLNQFFLFKENWCLQVTVE